MPSGSKSYHTRMGIRVDLPQEHEPHTALHLRLIPGGTTGPRRQTLRGWNHVEKRWRFVVGVPLLKRNTKTQNSPLPCKIHPSGGKFHQLSPTWISLTQLELFRYVQRFQRPKKKTATAPGVGMMPCIKAAVPVGLPLRQAFLSKTPLSGPRFEGGSKTTYGHTPFRYTVD